MTGEDKVNLLNTRAPVDHIILLQKKINIIELSNNIKTIFNNPHNKHLQKLKPGPTDTHTQTQPLELASIDAHEAYVSSLKEKDKIFNHIEFWIFFLPLSIFSNIF